MSDSSVSRAVSGKKKHVKGYFFKKVSDCKGSNGNFANIEVVDYKLEKKIAMLKSRGVYKPFNVYDELTNEFVGTWAVKSECSRALGLIDDYIRYCLIGKRTAHRGYTFTYVDPEWN